MTIEELKQQKRQLEAEIHDRMCECIAAFEEKTGFQVKGIDLLWHKFCPGGEKLSGVSVKVETGL